MIEQRKARRFELKLPFELVRSGSEKISQTGETRNVSSIGVLFVSHSEVEIGDPVEYVITLLSSPAGELVRIRCLGKVVRVEESGVAATLERYEFVRTGKGDPDTPAHGSGRGTVRRKSSGN